MWHRHSCRCFSGPGTGMNACATSFSTELSKLPVLSQQFIYHHTACRGDVQRMLHSEHRNPHVRIAERRYFRSYSVDLVPEDHANGKVRAPIEEIHSVHGGLNRCELIIALTQPLDRLRGLPGV